MVFRIRSHIARVAVAVAFIGVVSSGVLMAFVDDRPAAEKAESWAAAEVKAGRLPVRYDDVITLPSAQRRAVFANMSPEQKSELWKAQLRRFVAENRLSTQQLDFVNRFVALLTPAAYTPGTQERERAQDAMGPMCKEKVDLFTKEQRRAFTTIGPKSDESGDGFLVAFVRTAKQLFEPQSAVAGAAHSLCQCTSSFCESNCTESFPGTTCAQVSCTTNDQGCGCGNLFNCDWQCVPPD